MRLQEKHILYEVDGFWILDDADHGAYTVMRPSPSFTHSISDSGYERTPDGMSIAKARCDYLARRGGPIA